MEYAFRRLLLRLPLAAAAAVLAAALVLLLHGDAREAARPSLSAQALLSAPAAAGFARALTPRELEFPADHGAHPAFQTEWWYFTGVLEDPAQREFGFQLTFFRRASAPQRPASSSAWAANETWLAHFALSDVAGGSFRASERSQRAALGLAGAQADAWRVFVEGWSASGPGASPFPMRLAAADGDVALELELAQRGAPVLHGDRGLSRKGAEAGNASYYYSLVDLEARGRVRIGAQEFAVHGAVWMDREWSTSALAPGIAGWDWFALALDDGRALMFYRLRRADGSADALSEGTLIDADGGTRRLAAADVELEERARWTSPASGASYPAGWRLRVPSASLDLDIEPLLADQELRLSFTYWEGAVAARSPAGARLGRGYVELVGYADAPVASRSASRAAR